MGELMTYSEYALQQVRERRLLINEVDRWLFDEISPSMFLNILKMIWPHFKISSK